MACESYEIPASTIDALLRRIGVEPRLIENVSAIKGKNAVAQAEAPTIVVHNVNRHAIMTHL